MGEGSTTKMTNKGAPIRKDDLDRECDATKMGWYCHFVILQGGDVRTKRCNLNCKVESVNIWI